MNKGKHILVVPLNWGLGHATRMMPIIDMLLSMGHRVSIGGDGRSGLLLKNAYPQLTYYNFPSYQVEYPEGDQFIAKTLSRLPIYVNAIRQEHKALKKIVEQAQIDVVISDNRYGLYTRKVKSIFIGHQLGIILPKPFSFLRKALYKTHLSFLKNFDEIWIPDNEEENNLSGILSHQFKLPKKAKFIGYLSRFDGLTAPKKMDSISLLAVLSGPEPQRSIFQNKLVQQAEKKNITITIVEGKVGEEYDEIKNGIRYISYVDKERLFSLLHAAELVICRSGYSSIMDLAALGKKAFFVPTPGQTEQLYLAELQEKQQIAYYQKQEEFNLKTALEQSNRYTGFAQRDTSLGSLSLILKQL